MQLDYVVYMHTSPSGKRYVGITSVDPVKRWANGYGYAYNEHFFRAIMKYGWKNFAHEILEDGLSEQEACRLEQELIAKYDSSNPDKGYNLTTGGEKGFRHTEATKKKMSLLKAGKPSGRKGKHHSAEAKEKLRLIHSGKVLTEEHKRKIRETLQNEWAEKLKNGIHGANWGKRKPKAPKIKKQRVYNGFPMVCVETGEEFSSIRKVEKKLNGHRDIITKAYKMGITVEVNGLHFKKKEAS